MIKSMTGFGKATDSFQSKKVSIEVRSLNSKSLDLNVRMPSIYKELDGTFRKLASKKLGRGKVDFSVHLETLDGGSNGSINLELAKKYHSELKELSSELNEQPQDIMAMILRMPEIYTSVKDELTDEEKEWLIDLAGKAFDNLNDFRLKEGQDLKIEFEARIDDIGNLLKEVPKYENERIEIIRERMKKGLDEVDSGKYDNNRFEQEMIFYIEKLDVAEEKMRLENHLTYFIETMKVDQAGKKLGFIGQEIGREINTLGSKSNHAEMQKIVIDMKDNLEKIKEQILNTL